MVKTALSRQNLNGLKWTQHIKIPRLLIRWIRYLSFNCQLTNSKLKEMRENMFWILNRNENDVACTFCFELRAEYLASTFHNLFCDFSPKVSCLCQPKKLRTKTWKISLNPKGMVLNNMVMIQRKIPENQQAISLCNLPSWAQEYTGVHHQYDLHQYKFHQYEFQCYRYKIRTKVWIL